jgi:very-short-patch-repair endonuclease
MSEPETRLWLALRAKRLNGVKFTRQTVRDRAIPDFVARLPRLVIEVDGDTHAGDETYDARRTTLLENQGYHVLRFTNQDVMTNLEGVLLTIADALAARPLSQPSPLRGEGFKGFPTA